MQLLHYQPDRYQNLFADKVTHALKTLGLPDAPEPERFESSPGGFRLRAEFRIWHDGDSLDYVMFPPGDSRNPQRIDAFPIAAPRITDTMPLLKGYLTNSPELRRKLFQVEFLSTLSGELLITLIYHRPLSDAWHECAVGLADHLGCQLIGRSRKQKVVLNQHWIEEALDVEGTTFRYRQPEQCFTQPNGGINQKMMGWLLDHTPTHATDLLELYCGIGNFTLPLASRFQNVLATELSKPATEAARWNADINNIRNVEFARLSAEEMTSALSGERPFRRLAHLKQPLDQYQLNTLLVDPPRAGLDAATLRLASRFDTVLYISCNPQSLADNLKSLSNTHAVTKLAFFDQFPYTHHLESGVILTRRSA